MGRKAKPKEDARVTAQAGFEEVAQVVGNMPIDILDLLTVDFDELRKTERGAEMADALEEFGSEWETAYQSAKDALETLAGAGFKLKGGASWMA